MRHIELRSYPECVNMLKEARRKGESWEDLSTDPNRGPLLRQCKADEQGGLCGYCECRLTEADGTLRRGFSQLDHVQPRSRFGNLIFEWDNLILSCPCKEHCDHHKGNEVGIIDPHKENPRDFITFAFDELRRPHKVSAVARLGLDDTSKNRANHTINVLALNAQDLQRKRYERYCSLNAPQRLNDLMEGVEGDEILMQLAREEAMSLLEEIEEGEFPSAMRAICCKKLGDLLPSDKSN